MDMQTDIPTLDDVAALALTTDPTDFEQLSQLADSLDQLLAAHPAVEFLRQSLESLPAQLRRIISGETAPIEGEAVLIVLGRTLEEVMASLDEDSPRMPAAQGATTNRVSAEGQDQITLATDFDQEIVSEFVAESLDHIERAEQALLTLEAEPSDLEAINVIFRAFHTIKGSSAFLELTQIERLAHFSESLLSQVRDRSVAFSSSVADLVLQAADILRVLLEGVRGTLAGQVHLVPETFSTLLETLEDPLLPDRLSGGKAAEGKPSTTDVEPLMIGSPESRGAEAPGAPPTSGTTGTPGIPSTTGTPGTSEEDSVRIRVSRLDHLVDLVGELVVSHSMLSDDILASSDRQRAERIVARSNKILRELQDLSTSLRMVPLRPVFNRVARVARDAARKNHKEIRLVTSGEETELDRNMVSALADPLVHMVRNAIDHGIETAAERRAANKPETGILNISAYHEGGNVVVEITDDGRGLDREKILARARERGVIDKDEVLSDHDILHLIFAPGFSTAEAVTAISGRGVGMDVVKKAVESLRGRVEIQSVPGQGTRFQIQLPLTLAITDGILVRVGTERYILPTIKVQMSYRPSTESISTMAGKREMALLHEQIIPILRLHTLFQIQPDHVDPADAILVIIGEGARRRALMVDEVLGQHQFVVKAMSDRLTSVPGIAGGAIMGDGTVGLILDPDELLSSIRTDHQIGAAYPAA